jgi:tetratricopeptide (TPR) repeat protein
VEAEREFKRAIELNPNVADIHYRYGLIYLIPAGRMDEAIREIKRALELEPLSIAMNANLAGAYMYARQNDLALAQARKHSILNQTTLPPAFGSQMSTKVSECTTKPFPSAKSR